MKTFFEMMVFPVQIITNDLFNTDSVLGLSDRGASYMYGNSNLFGKNKKMKLS